MENSTDKRVYYKSLLFTYQDGLSLAPIIHFLDKKGVFRYIELKGTNIVYLNELCQYFHNFHKGYLNVAIRSLASQGIFTYDVNDQNSEVSFQITPKFKKFIEFKNYYSQFYEVYNFYVSILKKGIEKEVNLPNTFIKLATKLSFLKQSQKENEYVLNELAVHLEGILIIPLLVYLSYQKEFEATQIESYLSSHNKINIVFKKTGLINNTKLTDKGKYLVEKSYAFGVTVSYLPMLTKSDAILFGDFKAVFKKDSNGNEQHVFRGINVWGSGSSHSTYFKKIDTIITDLFNKPLALQPKGIIDIGCGNGAFIEHVFDVIWSKTKRRDDLHKNPLFLVGSDYNKEALLKTKHNLKKADIWAEVLWGDIGNPDAINKQLKEKYAVKLSDLLNIRSFLDHNRPFNQPTEQNMQPSSSTGAFCYKGMHLKNKIVEQSLIEHFKKWKPYINKYGMLLLELHTVSPKIISVNLSNTPCTAYDITHGFSDQYIVEVNVFKNALKRAGLMLDTANYFQFPTKDYPTVSINLIY